MSASYVQIESAVGHEVGTGGQILVWTNTVVHVCFECTYLGPGNNVEDA